MTREEFLSEWWAGLEKDMNRKYPANLKEMYTAEKCPCDFPGCPGWLIAFKNDKKGE